MLYRPSMLVSPEKVILVSTLVASTFTPAMTPPDGSVTRPVTVAVGPAKMTLVIRKTLNNTPSGEESCMVLVGFFVMEIVLIRLHKSMPLKSAFCTNRNSFEVAAALTASVILLGLLKQLRNHR